MGLGILFIGYFISTVVAFPFPEIGKLAGYLLMGYALTKLTQYEHRFSYARLLSFAVLILTLPSAVEFAANLLGLELAFPAFLTGNAYSYVNSVAELLFHLALYMSILKLATTTGEEKIRLSSARNLVFYSLLFIFNTVLKVLASLGGNIAAFAGKALLVSMLLYIVIIVLNHVMIYTAYMWICDESDLDMKIKDTGIAWFDNLRRKTAENEQKAADDTKEYLQKRYEEQQKKNRNKPKKKNRKR